MRGAWLSSMLLTGCLLAVPDRLPADDAGPAAQSDAGPGPGLACPGPKGPDCCSADNRPTGPARCADKVWTCGALDFCRCTGQVQPFFCSDFCGSDLLQPATCGPTGWRCESLLTPSSQCPSDTCWGLPVPGCVCVNGAWSCK